jgi:predicted nucleic acid-binding protein
VRYLDTSSLVALYYPEAKTARLEMHLRRRRSRLPFTWLHELELTNSLQLKVFRGEGTEAAVAATLAAVRADVEAGVFSRVQLAWPTVFEAALRLSAVYSRQLGTRTLDLLHVAAASLLNANEFITSDQRQSALAEREGLKVVLIP